MYRVELSRRASSYLERLPADAQARIVRRLDAIAADPLGPQTKLLEGLPGHRAARVGPWRIVYTVDQTAVRVNVSVIGPRGDIYRRI